jgi:transcriptional regulator with XRE-family HTH domain
MNLRGYSYRLVQANRAANSKHVGVRLGKWCISNDMPVEEVARFFGVSRMTVYSWFTGVSNPHKAKAEKIEEFLRT